MEKQPKFKVGDKVICVRDISGTLERDIGEMFVIDEFTSKSHREYGFICIPKGKNGEYECDLELDSKLHEVLA